MIDSINILGKMMLMLYSKRHFDQFLLKGGLGTCFFGVWPYLNI